MSLLAGLGAGFYVDCWIAGFLDLWISGFLNFWISGFLDLEHGWQFLHFPCKEFINSRAVRKFKISKQRKGNLVDPASSHMLVSKIN